MLFLWAALFALQQILKVAKVWVFLTDAPEAACWDMVNICFKNITEESKLLIMNLVAVLLVLYYLEGVGEGGHCAHSLDL